MNSNTLNSITPSSKQPQHQSDESQQAGGKLGISGAELGPIVDTDWKFYPSKKNESDLSTVRAKSRLRISITQT